MMPPRPTHPHLLAAAAALVVFSGPAARAQDADDLSVAPGYQGVHHGVETYDVVEIGSAGGTEPAVLPVKQYETNDDSLGWFHLRAHTITIHPNGVIDARGKGFRGSLTAGGGPGAGATPVAPVAPEPAIAAPGGGGARAGYGGTGATLGTPTCVMFTGSEGGAVYDWDPLQLQATGLGSSGGTGHSLVNPYASRNGGAGGGLVILEAVTLTIRGQILVDGADAPTDNGAGIQGVAAGGGAAGMVILRAQEFVFDDGASFALVSATGGVGATDRALEQATVVGGGGGGGLVLAELPLLEADVPLFQARVDVSGGVRTDLACGDVHPGGAGALQILPAPDCPDIDGDGYEASECGGQDCQDGDRDINPSRAEICNNLDDNCDGVADEDPDGGTAVIDPRCGTGTGLVCQDGVCVDRDAGPPVTVPEAPTTRLGGGLCAASLPGSSSAAAMGVLAGLLGVGALSRRRRSSGPPADTPPRDRE